MPNKTLERRRTIFGAASQRIVQREQADRGEQLHAQDMSMIRIYERLGAQAMRAIIQLQSIQQ